MNAIAKKTAAVLSAVLISLFFLASRPAGAAASDAAAVDQKFRALFESLSSDSLPRRDGRSAEPSFDEAVAVASGDWTALAKRYPNPWLPGEMTETDAPSPEALAAWWNTLGDEALTRLIERALKNNRNLRVARSKVVEARAQLGISKAAVLPWLDNTNSWGRSKTSVEAGGSGKTVELYRLKVDASWEIDIFGGRGQAVKADTAALEAQYSTLHDVWVSLSSEVALNYISLRTLQERLRIAQGNLQLQTETLEMLQSRYDAGLTDILALSQAQYTLQQTQALIPSLQRNVEAAVNVLSILVGDVPGSLEKLSEEITPMPKPVSSDLVGIPANSLRQRPDIRAAERRLAAQIARKKSAQADLWPKFYLFGSVGLESGSGGSLFSSGAQAWSFGPQITLPLFHGGAIRKNIQVQTARQEQALAAYEQTVLNAVAEVRNALTANVLEIRRNESLNLGVEAARSALAAANDQYRNGLSDFKNVIDAQRALLSLEEDQALSRGEMTSNVVRLFKALGGGWAPLVAENQPPAKQEKAKR